MQTNAENIIKAFITKFTFFRFHSGGNQNFDEPCIGYVLKGTGEFLYKGKRYYAKSGDLIYIARGTRYYSLWKSENEIEFYSITFRFNSDHAYCDYRFQILNNVKAEYFHNMYSASDPLLFMAELYKLLADIYKKMTKEAFVEATTIKPAIDYIEKNYKESVPIKKLAALSNISESHFFYLFKRRVGMTPTMYRHTILVENAIELLKHTDLSVEEISDRLGFTTSSYMRRVFNKITGHSPKEYRR